MQELYRASENMCCNIVSPIGHYLLYVLFPFSLLLVGLATHLQAEDICDVHIGELIYENNLDNPSDLSDWLLEGPGNIQWHPQKMVLIPDAQQAILDKWEEVGRRHLKGKEEYYGVAREQITQSNPDMVAHLLDESGNFVGGHIVCWNKVVMLEDNYCLEYDFRPLSPIGLAIVFFSAQGSDGRDVLAEELTPRFGVFRSYTHGDFNAYHISYWANNATVGIRHSSNLRKDSGFHLLASANDPTSNDLDYSKPTFNFPKFGIRIIKQAGRISFYVDGCLVLSFEDRQFNRVLNEGATTSLPIESGENQLINTGKVLGGGRFGLRQMVGLAAEYSNIRVYKLCD